MKFTTTTLATQHLVSAISYSNQTLSTDKHLVRQYQKKESKNALKKISTPQSANVNYYTKTGCLETYQTKYSKYWLT